MTKLRKSPHGGYLCTLKCGECPLSHQNNGTSEKIPCADFEIVYPLQAISIVQKWSNEHPQRTYLTEFLHHYPNVDLYENGIPIGICPRHLGLVNADSCAEKIVIVLHAGINLLINNSCFLQKSRNQILQLQI